MRGTRILGDISGHWVRERERRSDDSSGVKGTSKFDFSENAFLDVFGGGEHES